ncbi:MAG: hypothetical protein ACM30G_15770 [Micromonosporaceae bacterium]
MSNYSDRLVKRLGAALTVYAIVWFIATFGTFAALEWTGHRAMEGEVMPWLALAVLPAPGLGCLMVLVMAMQVTGPSHD